jgi:hypothetical protein
VYTNLGVALDNRDPRAAFETTRVGLEMSRRLGDRGSLLFELSNAAEQALPLGEWDWALTELAEALSGDLEAPNRLTLLAEVIPFRAFRGESVDDDLAEVESLWPGAGIETPDVLAGWGFLRAQAALADGRLRDAWDEAMTSATSDAVLGPRNLVYAARPALWARDSEAARAALESFDRTGAHGAAIDLWRTTILAGIAALEGCGADALAGYREALRGWRDLGVPWEQALTAVDALTLLGPEEPELRAAGEEAWAILARLGAKPILARLEEAMALRAGAENPPP